MVIYFFVLAVVVGLRKGMPRSLSSSLPELSSEAVVTIVMSMPMFLRPGSTVT